MKYTGFAMINPDDGMIMGGHSFPIGLEMDRHLSIPKWLV